jgi:Flp pilus assembly pilin Flp
MKKQILFFILFPFILFSQTQIGNDIDGEASGDGSGGSVSLSSNGNILAIGASGNDANGNFTGHVRIYQNIAEEWTQIGSDIDGEASDDLSGFSVSLSSDGSIVAIGAFGNDGNGSESGHVRVFNNIGGVWTQIGSDIDGEASGDQSGRSVSLSSDGSIVAIGAIGDFGNVGIISSGQVRIYQNISDVWIQIGSDIDGEAVGDQSGRFVSLSSDGSIVAIGADRNDGNGNESGHVSIYQYISEEWIQIGSDIDGEAAYDSSGLSVSLSSDGSIVAIGAFANDGNGDASGHVRIYQNSSGAWTQIGSDIDGEASGDQSGNSISLSSDGSIVAIGASGNGSGSGQVRIYQNISGVWTQIGSDIDAEAQNDLSGGSVSLSSDGSIVAIGAYGNDGNGANSGHVRVYDLSAVLSNDIFVLSQFNLYPNPVKEQFTIQSQEGLELQSVNIYNSLGQFIKSTNENVINTSELSAGIYYVEITSNKGKASKKIVIK